LLDLNNTYYPNFHSLATNSKQLDLLFQSPIDDNVKYVSLSTIAYIALGIGISILLLIIVISRVSFKLYKQNKSLMSYIKTLITTKSVDNIHGVEIK